MIPKKITYPLKTGLQFFLLLAIVALSLGPGVKPVFAFHPPPNDVFDPATAKVVGALPYTDTLDIAHATLDGPNPISCTDADGVASNITIKTSVWYKYIAGSNTTIVFDTYGSDFDTFLAVWKGSSLATLTPATPAGTPNCSDDTFNNIQSAVTVNVTPGTYYIQVGRYTGELDIENLVFRVSSGITVSIGGNLLGNYGIPSGQSVVKKYAVDGGPVEIKNSFGQPIIASLNQWRKRVGTTYWTGVSQSMGLPVAKVSNKYVLPRYDYTTTSQLYNAILIANLDGVARNVTVTIGGTAVNDTFSVPASSSVTKTYTGMAGGPVVVSSDSGAKIIASLYELRRDPTLAGWNGQSEMMGMPWEQLSDQYIIPQYFGALNPNTLDARLFIANADTEARTITVTIGGVPKETFTLQPNTGKVSKYAVDGGPVVISSAAGAKIIASLNQWRKRVGTTYWTGVAQSMGLPVGQVSNKYVLPRYDYTTTSQLYNAILIANLDGVARNVTVTIGGTTVNDTFSVPASSSVFKTYTGMAGGPVVVSSDSGAKIIASLYELRRDPTLAGWNGQSEMMGMPWEQLSDSYIIPQYFGALNPNTLDARLYIGVP